MPFQIDVDPMAFSVGALMIHWYGLIVAAAAGVAFLVAKREGLRLGLRGDVTADAAFVVGIPALVGGRLLFVAQSDASAFVRDPLSLIAIWNGGLSFYGAVLGAIVALALFARRQNIPFWSLADAAAPAAALGQAVGHIGCLITGDSYGLPTSVPWAVVYRSPEALAPVGVPLHPTQVYEALALTVLFAALWTWRHRLTARGPGMATAAYLLGLALIRFALFFLRDEPNVAVGLKTAQLISLAVAAAVLAAIALRHVRSAQPRTPAAAG